MYNGSCAAMCRPAWFSAQTSGNTRNSMVGTTRPSSHR